ncbi:MAG: flap endonuclease-1 [Candidatus Micrarchaeota archaeon]|nr:flap endonuclease-1 [Candidatus Micrarchaeota archaeon]
MGVDLGALVEPRPISLDSLSGRRIAVDAHNAIYQFLSIIRQRDGTPLMDYRGRVTSHISGLFHRTSRIVEKGIRPVYVFDGKPPELKRKVLAERREIRDDARKKWKDAMEKGDLEEARTQAQASSRLTGEMIGECKKLLSLMGIPFVEAPSEGEAQAAQMANEGVVDMCASQDYDALLFGAPLLIRNLTMSGRRKLPRKEIYADVEPESINLRDSLEKLGLDRQKLIWLAILVGTDFNRGVKGIGPKKAYKIIKESASLEEAVRKSGGEFEVDPSQVEEIFLNPPFKEVEVAFGIPDEKQLLKFLCDEHSFTESRVTGTIKVLKDSLGQKGSQATLDAWM